MKKSIKSIPDTIEPLKHNIWVCFILLCIVFVSKHQLSTLVNSQKNLLHFDERPLTDFIVLLFPLGIFIWFFSNFKKGFEVKADKKNLTAGTVFLSYIVLRSEIHFQTFAICTFFTYADVIIFFTVARLLIHPKTTKKQSAKNAEFEWFDDQPSLDKDDSFNRSPFAQHVSKFILGTTPETSFGVAINGAWGSGKTDFLNRIKENLIEQNVVCIDFNPWIYKTTTNLVEDFFEILVENLSALPQYQTALFKRYAEKLLKKADEPKSFIAEKILSFFFDEVSLMSIRKEVFEMLKGSNLKICVFVDDVDRLESNEIFEILRLIRNTGSFPNTFYVVAFDNNYLIDALEQAKKIPNPDKYLKKIFQSRISLPNVTKAIFKKELNAKFKSFLDNDDFVLFEKFAGEFHYMSDEGNSRHCSIDDALVEILSDIREMNLFINNFKTVYQYLKQETYLKDLIFVELVRNYFNEIYIDLKQGKVMNNFIKQKTDTIELYLSNIRTDLPNRQYLNFFVKSLWTEGDGNIRAFEIDYNKEIYFCYDIYDKPSLQKFRLFCSADNSVKEKLVHQYRLDNSLNIIVEMVGMSSWIEPQNFIKIFHLFLKQSDLIGEFQFFPFVIASLLSSSSFKNHFFEESKPSTYFDNLVSTVFIDKEVLNEVKLELSLQLLVLENWKHYTANSQFYIKDLSKRLAESIKDILVTSNIPKNKQSVFSIWKRVYNLSVANQISEEGVKLINEALKQSLQYNTYLKLGVVYECTKYIDELDQTTRFFIKTFELSDDEMIASLLEMDYVEMESIKPLVGKLVKHVQSGSPFLFEDNDNAIIQEYQKRFRKHFDVETIQNIFI